MKDFPKKPESILEDFFISVQQYIQDLIEEEADLMAGLTDFVTNAWEVPKEYKGQSGQMGFIPEYLIFETIKQYVGKKNNFAFVPFIRSKTFEDQIETNYFVDSHDNPIYLLCQGLRIHSDISNLAGLPKLDYAHDVSYLTKENVWSVKAIFEVKSYFETPSLEEDLNRLKHAEKNYPLTENYILVFVGFKKQDWLTKKEIELIRTFCMANNHYCVLPGDINNALGNSSLEKILNLIS